MEGIGARVARARGVAGRLWVTATELPALWPLRPADGVFLGVLLAWGLFVLAPSLSHPWIPLWDEGMHQAAARGAFDTPLYPHIYVDHLYPQDVRFYWLSKAWMNKPPGPFWFAALVMHVVGITPAALRFGSLLGALVGAAVIYFLARLLAGRLVAAVCAAMFLALPFGWQLVQGLFFGDATDCTLLGCNALAIALLVYSAERQSARAAIASGVVVGLGALCKVMLALTPLGVAGALWLLSCIRRTRVKGPRWWWVAAMFGAAALVCVPWNIYAALTYPEPYWMHARTWLGHLAPVTGVQADIGPWSRPADAIFNEIARTELRPLNMALPLLAGLWLAVRAIWKRETPALATALWLWATWTMLSLSQTKVPAVAWGAVPAAFIAIAVLFRDGVRLPPLGFAALGAALAPWVVERWPALGELRQHLPLALSQTRQISGLSEGLLLALVAGVALIPVTLLLRRRQVARAALGVPAALTLAFLFTRVPPARAEVEAEYTERLWLSHTREVGLAIDRATPKQSAVFMDVDREPPEVSEVLNHIFWSGRITYRQPPDVATARAKGYHPYVLSPAAEPFEPVAGVPANAWLRAYDLDRPTATPAPLPEGVRPVGAEVAGIKVLGAAAGPASNEQDRWAFYLSTPRPFAGLHVVFETAGAPVELRIPASACLRDSHRLAGAAWFVLPALGPKRADVRALRFDDGRRVEL